MPPTRFRRALAAGLLAFGALACSSRQPPSRAPSTPPAPSPEPSPDMMTDDLDRAVADQVSGVTSGLVIAIRRAGEMIVLDAWGTPAHEVREPLDPDHRFAFPAFTEMLLAATVRARQEAGELDASATLGDQLPDVPEYLAAITLDQLLTHSAGLDDLPPPDGFDWSDLLDELSRGARFTEPGLIASHSRYSYPLAAVVLERVMGVTLQEAVERDVLTPLDLGDTTFDLDEARAGGLATGYEVTDSEPRTPVPLEPRERAAGLPVAFTTASDVLRFLEAWSQGRIPGGGPPSSPRVTEPPNPLRDGLEPVGFRGAPGALRAGQAEGFGYRVRWLPGHRTGLLLWSNATGPRRVVRIVEDRLALALGLPDRFSDRSRRPPVPADAEGPSLEWAGTYRNGERIVVLDTVDGRLVFFDGTRNLAVGPAPDGTWAARLADGRTALVFRLVEVGGQRFVVIREHAHELREPGDAGR